MYIELIDAVVAANTPVIAVETSLGRFLWDGYHRVGASVTVGRTYIPAIVGTCKSIDRRQSCLPL